MDPKPLIKTRTAKILSNLCSCGTLLAAVTLLRLLISSTWYSYRNWNQSDSSCLNLTNPANGGYQSEAECDGLSQEKQMDP